MDRALEKVRQELRAFVGQTAFEELAQQWVIQQGKAGKLPHALFSRAGFTRAALDELDAQAGMAIDLSSLDTELG